MNDDNKSEEKNIQRVIIKGYLRPDGTYYVSIPKQIKETMNLKGGEYFVVKAKPEKQKISLKIVEFSNDEPEQE